MDQTKASRMFISLILCSSALLTSCATQSDSDKAFSLIQDACGIEKNSDTGEFVSSESGESFTTWDPRTIGQTALNEKLDSLRQRSKSALQASYLDSKWDGISQPLETMTQTLTYFKSALLSGDQDSLTWSEEDFNVPLGTYKRNCEAVASLMND